MSHSVTRSPRFLFSGQEDGPDPESIVANNNAAVRYLRKGQLKIAQVMATTAVRNLQNVSLLPHDQQPSNNLQRKPADKPCSDICREGEETTAAPGVSAEGFLIRDSQLGSQGKLILLYNLGLIQQLAATSESQIKSAIVTYKEALKEIPNDVSPCASEDALLSAIHVKIWNQLAACFAKVADGDGEYQKHEAGSSYGPNGATLQSNRIKESARAA